MEEIPKGHYSEEQAEERVDMLHETANEIIPILRDPNVDPKLLEGSHQVLGSIAQQEIQIYGSLDEDARLRVMEKTRGKSYPPPPER